MSTPRKTFGAKSLKHDPPIEFDIVDDDGELLGTFRATRKPRTDIVQALAVAVTLKDDGQRAFHADVICESIRQVLVRRIWQSNFVTEPDENGVEMQVERGSWVDADDVERFDALLKSDEVMIPIQQLGEICMWLVSEMTSDPTGAFSQ